MKETVTLVVSSKILVLSDECCLLTVEMRSLSGVNGAFMMRGSSCPLRLGAGYCIAMMVSINPTNQFRYLLSGCGFSSVPILETRTYFFYFTDKLDCLHRYRVTSPAGEC